MAGDWTHLRVRSATRHKLRAFGASLAEAEGKHLPERSRSWRDHLSDDALVAYLLAEVDRHRAAGKRAGQKRRAARKAATPPGRADGQAAGGSAVNVNIESASQPAPTDGAGGANAAS